MHYICSVISSNDSITIPGHINVSVPHKKIYILLQLSFKKVQLLNMMGICKEDNMSRCHKCKEMLFQFVLDSD